MRKIIYFVSEDWVFLNHRLELIKKIKATGFKVILITKITDFKKEIEKHNVKVIGLKAERGSLNIRKSAKDIYKIFKIYQKEKPDIVHHFGIRQVVHGNIAAKLAKVKKSFNSIIGLGSIFISSHFLKRFFIKNILRFSLFLKKSYVFVQNKDDLEFFKKNKLTYSKELFLVTASGIDTKKFITNKEPRGKIIFLFASRLIKDKGILELINAIKKLKLKKNNFEVFIAGSPDSQNPSSITSQQLESWESLNYIKYLGQVKDMVALYKKIHVAILPSYREGLPKGLLEAASCGKPIITTDVPGCREIVINEINGILVPPKDINALINAMKKLINNKKLRKSMGNKGREIIKKNFSIKTKSQELISFYK